MSWRHKRTLTTITDNQYRQLPVIKRYDYTEVIAPIPEDDDNATFEALNTIKPNNRDMPRPHFESPEDFPMDAGDELPPFD